MEPEKLPIKDLEEAVLFVCDAALFGLDLAQGGKLDLVKTLALLPGLQLAVQGYDQIFPEVIDLDSDEAAQLVTEVMNKFNVANPKAKAIVSAAVKMLPGAFELFKAVKG